MYEFLFFILEYFVFCDDTCITFLQIVVISTVL